MFFSLKVNLKRSGEVSRGVLIGPSQQFTFESRVGRIPWFYRKVKRIAQQHNRTTQRTRNRWFGSCFEWYRIQVNCILTTQLSFIHRLNYHLPAGSWTDNRQGLTTLIINVNGNLFYTECICIYIFIYVFLFILYIYVLFCICIWWRESRAE